MAQFSSQSSRPLSWWEVWMKALTQPSEATFQQIIHDPGAKRNRAYNWMAIIGVIQAVIAALVPLLLSGSAGASIGSNFGFARDSLISAMICDVPLTALFSVIGLIITVLITHFIAVMLGGEGPFDDLLYGTAAYLAPLSLIITILNLIPSVGGVLAGIASIYGFVLKY